MGSLCIVTRIQAPIERCFDLARSIELHMRSTASTSERAIAGTTTGLIGAGQDVTWRARHFGVWQRFTSRITAYDRPTHFRDSMVRGAFQRFEHDHDVCQEGAETVMTDRLIYQAPCGVAGIIAERLFLTRYLQRFLTTRAQTIQRVAESAEWMTYL